MDIKTTKVPTPIGMNAPKVNHIPSAKPNKTQHGIVFNSKQKQDAELPCHAG